MKIDEKIEKYLNEKLEKWDQSREDRTIKGAKQVLATAKRLLKKPDDGDKDDVFIDLVDVVEELLSLIDEANSQLKSVYDMYNDLANDE